MIRYVWKWYDEVVLTTIPILLVLCPCSFAVYIHTYMEHFRPYILFSLLQVHVRLSHPVEMDIVLRKRISVSIYRQKAFSSTFRRKIQSKVIQLITENHINSSVSSHSNISAVGWIPWRMLDASLLSNDVIALTSFRN